MHRARVYLSGPISGDGKPETIAANIAELERVGMLLRRMGFAPFVPTADLPGNHLTHSEWMAWDYPYVAVAEFVLRIPGQSPGADLEQEFAFASGIPVYLYDRALTGDAYVDIVAYQLYPDGHEGPRFYLSSTRREIVA